MTATFPLLYEETGTRTTTQVATVSYSSSTKVVLIFLLLPDLNLISGRVTANTLYNTGTQLLKIFGM